MSKVILKPSPDITENYIRFRIRDPKLFKKESFRTIIISSKKKIKAVVGILKSDEYNKTKIQSFLFVKDVWTTSEAQEWVDSHLEEASTSKADDLGQVSSPSGDEMPMPISSLKTFKCKKCNFEMQALEKPYNCPLCGGDMIEVRDTSKSIILPPQPIHDYTLENKVYIKFLDCKPEDQKTIEIAIPFYKLAIYSKAIDYVSVKTEYRDIDIRWGWYYTSPTYENLETSRDKKEKLMSSGYRLVKGSDNAIISFHPSMTCQILSITCAKESSYAEDIISKINGYVNDNNFFKNEKITPFGLFLPLSNINKSNVILKEDIFKALDKSIFSFFNSKEKYIKADIPFKRGVIFSGKPGTGKTLSGKILMNNIKDVTFIWVTAKDFMCTSTSYLFNMARELSPAILFIEDVDRCLEGKTLDAIKTEMDGLVTNDGILTILSTNFPESLPKTLINRPGRFDDIIEFKLPEALERFKILNMYSKKVKVIDRNRTIAEVAKKTEGLTPSHLKEIVVRTIMLCDGDNITLDDFSDSISHIKKIQDRYSFTSTNKSHNIEVYSSIYKEIVNNIKNYYKK